MQLIESVLLRSLLSLVQQRASTRTMRALQRGPVQVRVALKQCSVSSSINDCFAHPPLSLPSSFSVAKDLPRA